VVGSRRGRHACLSVCLVVATALACEIVTSGAVVAAPQAHLVRLIRTTPFANKAISMKDAEGSAYVPRDHSLWLADDYGRRIYEVNPSTGALKRVIGQQKLAKARRLGGGAKAGIDRTRDLESIAYDRERDALYVFSGPCCTSSVKPAAFRLTRIRGGRLRVESFQPLPRSANYTAAAWNAANHMIYVGQGRDLRSYRYPANEAGRVFHIPDLSGITGMSFSPNGASLFVTTTAEQLRRVVWPTKKVVAGWVVELGAFGVGDARAVELIDWRYFVLDGNPARPDTDPRKYAVYVFRMS
jgi:Esterase-like activity of phytase